MASGDTLELSVNHPTVGARNLNVKAEEDINLDAGGYKSQTNMNGNGTGHEQKNAKPWKITGLMIESEPGDDTLEFIQAIQDATEAAVFTWEHTNGTIYKGTGTFQGDVLHNTNSGYIPCEIGGAGRLEKLV